MTGGNLSKLKLPNHDFHLLRLLVTGPDQALLRLVLVYGKGLVSPTLLLPLYYSIGLWITNFEVAFLRQPSKMPPTIL